MCTGTHAFIPAPDTARVRMIYSQDAQTVMNVFYFTKSGGWDSGSLHDLADVVSAAWTTHMKVLQSNGLTLETIEATDVSVDAGAQYTLSVGASGTHTAPALPNNVTWAIKFTSGLTGRSNRGRMYFLGLVEDQVDSNTVTIAASSGILTGIEGFFAEIQADEDAFHVIVSYCNAGAWRTTAVTNEVSGYSYFDTTVDSQRRRLPGRGR